MACDAVRGGDRCVVGLPICVNAGKLDENAMIANARLVGATPMFDSIGDDDAAIFSY